MSLTVDEERAAREVSPEVGAYLDEIGKTDLADMTETEWLGFIAHAYASVAGRVRQIWTDEVPF